MKFQLLIKAEMLIINDFSCYQTFSVFILIMNILKANICWHFNIYERDKFCAQLSMNYFAPLAVRVHTGCSVFPFYTLTKPLMQLHITFINTKTVLLPKL